MVEEKEKMPCVICQKEIDEKSNLITLDRGSKEQYYAHLDCHDNLVKKLGKERAEKEERILSLKDKTPEMRKTIEGFREFQKTRDKEEDREL